MTRTIDITITISDDTDEEVAADIFDAVVESVAEQVNDSTNTAKAVDEHGNVVRLGGAR